MEKSSKRGKIPQSDWPLIMARYDSGETLASIARTYDCSPPAISYVVSRSRARQPGSPSPSPSAPPAATEPQLVKAEAATAGIAKSPAATASAAAALPPPAPPRRDELPLRPAREINGFARDGAARRDAHPPAPGTGAALAPRSPTAHGPGNGDARRTLHLSLGSASLGNGAAPLVEATLPERPDFATLGEPAPPQTVVERAAPPADRAGPPGSAADSGRDGTTAAGLAIPPAGPYHHRLAQQAVSDGARRKDAAGPFIDKELRARVDNDIAAFLAAFDVALAEDTQESRSALREATDRLLRAGARTRIELERLEARLPLPSRDGNGRIDGAWRHR